MVLKGPRDKAHAAHVEVPLFFISLRFAYHVGPCYPEVEAASFSRALSCSSSRSSSSASHYQGTRRPRPAQSELKLQLGCAKEPI